MLSHITHCPNCGSSNIQNLTTGFWCGDCGRPDIYASNYQPFPDIDYKIECCTGFKECTRCGDMIPNNRSSPFCRNCRIALYDKGMIGI